MRVKIGKKTLVIRSPVSLHTINEVCGQGRCKFCESYGITAEQARNLEFPFPFVMRGKDGSTVMPLALFLLPIIVIAGITISFL